jgi:hypothetical protein
MRRSKSSPAHVAPPQNVLLSELDPRRAALLSFICETPEARNSAIEALGHMVSMCSDNCPQTERDRWAIHVGSELVHLLARVDGTR